MSFLFGSQPKVVPEFTGFQIDTAVQVLPVPIIYGGPRAPSNMIYYNGFKVEMVSTGGGKGVLTGGKGPQEVEYFATIIMSIGEGIITEVLVIYDDQAVYTPKDFPDNGAIFFEGTDTQPPWSVVVTKWPTDARTYKDTCYYGFPGAQLDSSATVPQLHFVPKGIFSGTCPLNDSTITITTGQFDQNGNPISFIGNIHLGFIDADPGQCIYDFLTNPRYGAGFPAQFIDQETLLSTPEALDPNTGDMAVSTMAQAVGLGWSVCLNNAESGNSILERWSKNLNCAPVWTGSELRFVPYWDRYASANPNWSVTSGLPQKYFNPYTIPLTTITLDQILQSKEQKEDPITWDRKDPLTVFNTVRVNFKDRTNFFNDNVVEAKDEVHAELFGERVDNIGLASEYTLQTYANVVAQMQLRRNISIMRTFSWRMSPLWGWMVPMNIVAIPDPSNLSTTVVVRITEVEDDEEENCTFTAEEYPVGSQSPTLIPVSPTTPPNQNPTNNPPLPVFPPMIFEPTTAMLTATGFATPQVIIGTSGGEEGFFDQNWGGYRAWISLDATSFELVTPSQMGPSTYGVTANGLPAYGGSNPDVVDSLVVNLNQSDGALPSVAAAGAATGASLCVIKDASGIELLSYTTATLTGTFEYTLTGLYRGLYGTTPREFGAGSLFLFVGTSGNFFETALPPQYVGKTFYVKLQSFNVFNTTFEDLDTCQIYEYVAVGPTPIGPVAPPTAPLRRERQNIADSPRLRRRRYAQ